MPSPIDVAAAKKRQQSIVAYIREFSRVHGYGPSRTDLVGVFGVSPGTIRKDLLALRDQGQVTWTRNRARTLRTLE